MSGVTSGFRRDRMSRVTLSVLIAVGLGPAVRADGLAYRLPPDGTWVLYRIHCDELPAMYRFRVGGDKKKVEEKEAIDLAELKKRLPADWEDVFLVRSVGRVEQAGEACRWIELVNNPREENEDKPKSRVIVLKLLIPEKDFAPGHDPFAHVRKMYMSDRRPDEQFAAVEVTDADRRTYELDRFRTLFPVPPPGAKRSAVAGRKTGLGTVGGYELEFDYGFEGKLHGGRLGRNAARGHYKVLVSEAAPFGIAEIHAAGMFGIEETADGSGSRTSGGRGRVEVKASGGGAKSGLPEKQ
jgi:hypothetical protein